jgi:RNA polymerase sigma factor (sigma-70 family)
MSDGSVSRWLPGLAAGESGSTQQIFERYFEQLLRVARGRLTGALRRLADEEDVVISAFYSFFEGANQGRFPRLNDRFDLWRLLLLLTVRKIGMQARRATAEKRGGGGQSDGDSAVAQLEEIVSQEPTAEMVHMAAEEYQRLLTTVGDPLSSQVVDLKLAGYRNSEIALRLQCSERTVERKLERIRDVLRKEAGE